MHQIIRLMKAFQPQRTFDAPRASSGVFKGGGALGNAPPQMFWRLNVISKGA